MRVLLVDHDSEALETITRAIRGVLELDCVTSKGDALLLLRQNTYDVLIACERCVDGSGLDLLGRTTRTAVPLKRIFAAAPERLQLLGPRLAPFKVQRTINYPIDLEELWLAIAQVTSGPNDETDGTIERVVLDERGIPAIGQRAARADSAAPAGAAVPRCRRAPPAIASAAAAPPPHASRSPRRSRPCARRRRRVSRRRPCAHPRRRGPLPIPAACGAADTACAARPHYRHDRLPVPQDFPAWTPEPPARGRLRRNRRAGALRRAAESRRRGRAPQTPARVTAGGIAMWSPARIVLLIEKFYDPAARAREAAIATESSAWPSSRRSPTV